MCDVGAICPNCGQRELDNDERLCFELDGVISREYRCRACAAYVSVTVVRTPWRRSA